MAELNKKIKKCKFFVVPRDGHALLSMPDTDVLNIIKINIDSIGAEDARDSDKWCTNMHTVWGSEPKQETGRVEKCYTNIDNISKLRDNKTKAMVNAKSHKTTEYFLSGPNYESDKSAESTQQIHKDFDDVFNGTGCFEGTFSLQLKPDSKPYQAPPRCVAYALQNCSRRN